MLNNMKSRYSGKKTLILFLMMTAYLFSQGWNNIVTTTINEPNLIKMDLFTNKDGNHIIVQNSNSTNSIKYYLLNSSGTVVRSATIETAGGAELPNVSGDNDKVYLVYKSGSNLKSYYTTNAGLNWNSVSPKAIGSNTCNGVDIVYDYQGLHVVYAMKDNGSDYETYYYKLNSSNSWVDYKNVTDYGTEVGEVPSVTISNNRIHVSYNTGNADPPYVGGGVSKSRDRVGTVWQTPQLISDGEIQYGTSGEKLRTKGNSLYSMFFDVWVDLGQWGYYVQVKSRDLTATSWPSAYTTLFTTGYASVGLSSETTSNGNLHIVNFAFDNGILYKYFDGNNWSSDYTITTDYINYDYNNIGLSTSSNDLFVTWKANNSNYLKYRQYDAVPLTPPNFAGTSYNNHPKITWSACKEPDVFNGGHIKVFRGYEDEVGYISYMLAATIGGNSISWVDDAVTLGNPRTSTHYFYKISSVDLMSHESPTTNPIEFSGTGPIWKNSDVNTDGSIKEFSLYQNYPNPFNPSTKISYSIKEEGLVTLKVYDVLGKEIATLVNENKPAGLYEAEFDASSLPSGMYIYKIQSGQFSDVKKMLLTK